ncbi:PH domain-containing protein [Ornithinimicrobium murale]|uniref:PH domain-containing protein n=1 Tax=Ornithinimicrobium murale TaxID=1050153 RepID=UPI0013B434CF|nr:PH domain-containing protein [Ornithinimicrobium murale]
MDVPHTAEQTLFSSRTHAKILVPALFIQGLLLGVHLVLPTLWPDDTGIGPVDDYGHLVVRALVVLLELTYVVIPALRWWHSVFSVTTNRVSMSWGVFTKHSRELATSRITQVNVERGLLDRLFGCGTIVLRDAGSIEPVRLADVPHVHQVRQLIDDLRFEAPSNLVLR